MAKRTREAGTAKGTGEQTTTPASIPQIHRLEVGESSKSAADRANGPSKRVRRSDPPKQPNRPNKYCDTFNLSTAMQISVNLFRRHRNPGMILLEPYGKGMVEANNAAVCLWGLPATWLLQDIKTHKKRVSRSSRIRHGLAQRVSIWLLRFMTSSKMANTLPQTERQWRQSAARHKVMNQSLYMNVKLHSASHVTYKQYLLFRTVLPSIVPPRHLNTQQP